MNDMSVLRVDHYGETSEDNRRITIAPMNVVALAAETDDIQVQGRTLRNITVLFVDGGTMPLTVNHQDMETLESTIGAYCFE